MRPILALVLFACPSPAPTGDDTGPAWDIDERFDTLDASVWSLGTWVLGATQLDPAQARVAEGLLSLSLDEVDGQWRGAELGSLLSFTGGRFEARIAAPSEPGSVCGFFLYGEDGEGRVHEIDVELLSAEPDTVRLGTYAAWTKADGYEAGPHRGVRTWRREGFSTAEWHEYAWSWEVGRVSFEVDGVVVGEVEAAPTDAATLRLNHWTSVTWPEVQGPPAGSSACRVDWIRGRAQVGR